MTADLDLPVGIVAVPTQRDADGLALSSRNAYLSSEERLAARALPRALVEAAQAIRDGASISSTLEEARARLAASGFAPIDYVELRDAESLQPVRDLARPARLLAAARLGRTRLIDNIEVAPIG
jgi:pantoate--beta-alanine ligase